MKVRWNQVIAMIFIILGMTFYALGLDTLFSFCQLLACLCLIWNLNEEESK